MVGIAYLQVHTTRLTFLSLEESNGELTDQKRMLPSMKMVRNNFHPPLAMYSQFLSGFFHTL